MMALKDALPDALKNLGVESLDLWNEFCDKQKRQSRETARDCALATPPDASPEEVEEILDTLRSMPYSKEALETYQLTRLDQQTRSELSKGDV